MVQDRLSGKLAVILHADVAGSTQMVQQDEYLAHVRIQDTFHRFSATIKEYSGQVLELRGDALLAEFERPSDAVAATLAFQFGQTEFLSSLNDDLKPEVRVGIAMGEVVVADNTITGAGVVMAQRVEQLADAGSLCITAAVRESLSGRLSVEFKSLGQQDLKGFEEPIGVFKVSLSENAAIPPPTSKKESGKPDYSWKNIGTLTIAAFMILAGIVYWANKGESIEEIASIERMAYPLPDKPSIAVLPLNNVSNDPEQEFFADGMTEDLITDISKVSGLFVIARNSVFTYKGKAVKVRQVAEELGVRYVMEGSVRRAGNQVRVNAQLIDATTGGHLWAERYDGSLDDVFSMQDQITKKIVDALAITLVGQEQESLSQVETSSPEAHDAYLQGWEHYRRETPNDFTRAIRYFERALELDPEYHQARTALAAVYWNSTWRRWIKTPGLNFSQISEQARQYLQDAKKHPTALTYQVASEMAADTQRSASQALAQAELALTLDGNDPAGHLAMANALIKAKRPAEAIESMQQAMRLDPHYPAFYLTRLGRAQFDLGRYEESAATLKRATERNPQDDRAHMYLAAAYGFLGRLQDARVAAANADKVRLSTGWGRLNLEEITYYKWVGDRNRLREGLKKVVTKTGYEWFSLITRTGDSFKVEGATKIDAETAKQLHDRGVPFVDIGWQFFENRIPGAINLTWYRGINDQKQREFNEARLLEIVDKSQELVVHSSRGYSSRAAQAAAAAVVDGFERVYYFEGGLGAWKAAGYPVDTSKLWK